MNEKEKFIAECRSILNANEKQYHVNLDQLIDMIEELAESYK
jgi:hypothetical protein